MATPTKIEIAMRDLKRVAADAKQAVLDRMGEIDAEIRKMTEEKARLQNELFYAEGLETGKSPAELLPHIQPPADTKKPRAKALGERGAVRKRLLEALKDGQPHHVKDIATATGFPLGNVRTNMSSLEKGKNPKVKKTAEATYALL
jgi:hypothetical protein